MRKKAWVIPDTWSEVLHKAIDMKLRRLVKLNHGFESYNWNFSTLTDVFVRLWKLISDKSCIATTQKFQNQPCTVQGYNSNCPSCQCHFKPVKQEILITKYILDKSLNAIELALVVINIQISIQSVAYMVKYKYSSCKLKPSFTNLLNNKWAQTTAIYDIQSNTQTCRVFLYMTLYLSWWYRWPVPTPDWKLVCMLLLIV